MKILVLTSTYARKANDTEPRFVDNLCCNLRRADPGNEIHVIAPHAPGIPTLEVMEGIPVYRFRYWLERWQSLAYEGGILPSIKQNPLRLLQVPAFLVSQFLLARKLLRQNNYDVIHAHWIIPQGLVVALLKKCSGPTPPIVITSHGGDLFSLKGKALGKIKKWVIESADRLTLVSDAMKSLALEQGLVQNEKAAVIPMGVDARVQFLPPSPDTQREGLLFVGRLVDKKGIEYLISALPAVLTRFPSLSVTVIGDGPLDVKLRHQAKELGLADKVQFLGAKSNREVPNYLQRASVTVFPSVVTDNGDQEGTPVAIMEALACGCAVIVSEYPGSKEIIEDGHNGLLVPQRAPEHISQAILTLLESPSDCQKYGDNGRKTVEARFDWRVVSGQFLGTFDELAAANSRSS